MTVAAGVFVQVFLVILLGREEIPEGLQFHSQLCAGFLFFRLIKGLNLRKEGFIRIVDTGTVLNAFIMSLAVDGQGINDHEIVLQQFRQCDTGFIIIDAEGFGMAAVSADILIGRGFVRTVGITDFCAENAVFMIPVPFLLQCS